jgi:ABC-type lipoprotein release transport system permease subunit
MVFGILMALSLITSIISALIPVTRIANKKPIDAIQNI